jgi:hypothetical protein
MNYTLTAITDNLTRLEVNYFGDYIANPTVRDLWRLSRSNKDDGGRLLAEHELRFTVASAQNTDVRHTLPSCSLTGKRHLDALAILPIGALKKRFRNGLSAGDSRRHSKS